ncbi:hypothetical protein MPER_03515 [Moniliophthora perniciosa FA553]|nr:hypothetical protein MPER_03515 [Moniliophthora perniciosa FA553]
MLAYSRERKDEKAIEFWNYVVTVTYTLGHDGMSDEESGTEEVTTPSGLIRTKRIKKVLKLPWRHSSFRDLFTHLDQVPQVEDLIFKQTGKHVRIDRVRVEDMSTRRSIPKKLYRSFFKDGYLNGLMEYQVDKLDLAEEDFQLHNFKLDDYEYRYPDGIQQEVDDVDMAG